MAAEDHHGGRSPSVNPTRVDHSLDEVARGLASGNVSRRRALKIMGGALLGSVLAAVPGTAWANDCRPSGSRCRGDRQCCTRNCVPNPSGEGRICGCPAGKTACKERCVNLQRNERHCGACFNRCPEDFECVGGQCVPQCGPGVVCDVSFTQCGQETGQLCACTDRLEGGTVCGATFCGPPCTSSDECVQVFGPGAVCQAPGTGCCGQACIPACGATTAAAATSTGGSNVSSS